MAGIPVWKEGTQRYHDPESQKMVKTTVAEGQIAEEKTKGKATGTIAGFGAGSALGSVAGPIVASLRKEFGALNSHLAFRFEDIKKAILGDPTEQREKRLEGENVVKPPAPGEGPPDDKKGFLGSLKDRFSGGIGTKTAILLLVGGLWAISTLGDKLTKPLAKFLKWLKEDALGDVSNLHKDVMGWWSIAWGHMETFFAFMLKLLPEIGVLHDKLKKWYEEDWPLLVEKFTNLKTTVGLWWDEQWPKVEKFWDWMKGIFASIGAYVDKFDIDGTPGLSPDERKAMFDDLISKVWNAVKDAAGGWVIGLGSAILAYAIGMPLYKAGVAIAGAKIAAAVAGGAPVVGAAGAVLSKVGIAGMVAGSLIAIFVAGRRAMTTSIDEETGKLDFTEFASSFIAGDKEGGWKNAIGNAFEKGAMGAGIGVTIGAAFGPAGMLVGGLMGMAIGGVIGGITGLVGADKMDTFIQGTVNLMKGALDDIGHFFGSFIAGIESWVRGEGYQHGVDVYQNTAAAAGSVEDIDAQLAALDVRQADLDANTDLDDKKRATRQRMIDGARNRLLNQKRQLGEAKAAVNVYDTEDIMEAQQAIPQLRTELANIDRTKKKSGWERKENRILADIKKHEAVLRAAGIDPLELTSNLSAFSMHDIESVPAFMQKDIVPKKVRSHIKDADKGTVILNTGDSNVVHQESNTFSELTPDNREMSAALANQYQTAN